MSCPTSFLGAARGMARQMVVQAPIAGGVTTAPISSPASLSMPRRLARLQAISNLRYGN